MSEKIFIGRRDIAMIDPRLIKIKRSKSRMDLNTECRDINAAKNILRLGRSHQGELALAGSLN